MKKSTYLARELLVSGGPLPSSASTVKVFDDAAASLVPSPHRVRLAAP